MSEDTKLLWGMIAVAGAISTCLFCFCCRYYSVQKERKKGKLLKQNMSYSTIFLAEKNDLNKALKEYKALVDNQTIEIETITVALNELNQDLEGHKNAVKQAIARLTGIVKKSCLDHHASKPIELSASVQEIIIKLSSYPTLPKDKLTASDVWQVHQERLEHHEMILQSVGNYLEHNRIALLEDERSLASMQFTV